MAFPVYQDIDCILRLVCRILQHRSDGYKNIEKLLGIIRHCSVFPAGACQKQEDQNRYYLFIYSSLIIVYFISSTLLFS